MAIYHYHRGIGKRSKGKNAVFAAAYIRGEERTCLNTQENKDFSNRLDVVYTDCILPDDAPAWAINLRHSKIKNEGGQYVYDISGRNFSDYVWNQIEIIEKRSDAQLYFHDDIAIPQELGPEAAIELVRDFVKESLAVDGVFCDIAIHWEAGNPHAHVMLPLRQMTETGFSNKVRFTRASLSNEVNRIRAAWSEHANRKLKEQGIEARIDHRSYQERGIALTPTIKVGKATHMHGSEHQELKIAENQLIRAKNYQAIQADPNILTAKLAQEHLELSEQQVKDELAKYVVNAQVLETLQRADDASQEKLVKDIIATLKSDYAIFSEKELKQQVLAQAENQTVFEAILQKIHDSRELINLGLGDDGRLHFASRQAFHLENHLYQLTEKLANQHHFLVADSVVKTVAARYGLNESQKKALAHLTQTSDLALVVGVAGSGKTYLLKAAYEVWQAAGYRVQGVAFQGRAAAALENDSGIPSHTISRFLHLVKAGHLKLDAKTIIVMDEMGMTALDDMQQVIKIVEAAGSGFKGVGDTEQTQPIGRGAPMRAMMEAAGCVRMDTIIRQQVDWQKAATLAMETQSPGTGLDAYDANGCITFVENRDNAIQTLTKKWFQQYQQDGRPSLAEYILIAHKNETVNQLNKVARDYLVKAEWLEEGKIFKTSGGEIKLAAGERLLFGKNDYKIGLRNGDFATLIAIQGDRLTVKLDNGKEIQFNVHSYAHFNYGYAATVHKLQGFTGNYAFEYIDSRGWNRHLLLVGSSRHRLNLNIIADHTTFKDYTDLKTVVSRNGLKDHIFDYPLSFAIRRGFEAENIVTRAVQAIRQSFSRIHDSWLYLMNYQLYLEQKNQQFQDPHAELNQRRQEAKIVADFCDNRELIAQKLTILAQTVDRERASLQQEIYHLQIENSRLAYMIQSDYAKYQLAMERNRLDQAAVEKAIIFGENRQKIELLITQYRLKQFYQPKISDDIYRDLKTYYPHIMALAGHDKNFLNTLMADVKHMSMQARYETAIMQFGIGERAQINIVKRYLDLDYEISRSLKKQEHFIQNKALASKIQLHEMSSERDSLAAHILGHSDKYAALIDHFELNIERLNKHQNRYNDRQQVKYFSQLPASEKHQENLVKQALAHQIKKHPKRFGIYVNDFLTDGWRSIHLENWRFERRLQIARSQPDFKASLQLVQRYFETARLTAQSWQAAKKRRENGSIHYDKFVKRAQGFAFQRDQLAYEIYQAIEKHSAALTFEKINLNKLIQQARRYAYFSRYLAEENPIKKMRLAAHIVSNAKEYGHLITAKDAYFALKEQAHHRNYLLRIKVAPDAMTKEAIHLVERYQLKRQEAAASWHLAKTQEKIGKNAKNLLMAAKHLTYQRNKAAYDYLVFCSNNQLIEPEIAGVKIDYAALQKASQQHIAYQRLQNYLNSTSAEKNRLAYELLQDRSSYHFIYDKKLNFADLRQQSQTWLKYIETAYLPRSSATIEIKHWHYEAINHALMQDPQSTYLALFGEPKKRNASEWRYPQGLIVSLKGSQSGTWYSFSENRGGGPIQAIQDRLNLPFKEALAYGARLAGLSEIQATRVETRQVIHDRAQEATKKREQVEQQERARRVEAAQSIWQGTQAILGTLAEKYFVEHRQITRLANMEIRYWPVGSAWVDYDEKGHRQEKINKIPAAVIAAKDQNGTVTGVQRIYLDPQTGAKNRSLDSAKFSKGITKGAAGVIQIGEKGGRLYLTEGPETAASIALADPKATVLTAFSVSNLGNLAAVMQSYMPNEVILAADNDGIDSPTRKTTEQAVAKLRAEGLAIRAIYPQSIAGQAKVDWNDVLVQQGLSALKQQLNIPSSLDISTLYYHQGQEIDYTPAEYYVRVANGLVGVSCAELRYHPAIPLPDSQQTHPGLIIPAINAQGEIVAEKILYLDAQGESLIATQIRGDSANALAIIQKGDDYNTLYLADNFLDAKAISLAHPNANIFMPLHGYQQLEKISGIFSQLPQKPDAIALTVNRFDAELEQTLGKAIQPLQHVAEKFFLVKGHLNGNAASLRIHQALIRQQQIRGDNYMQHKKLEIAHDKIPFTARFGKRVKTPEKGRENRQVVLPEKTPLPDYYVKFTADKLQIMRAYFAAFAQLKAQDNYPNALNLAQAAAQAYQALTPEITQVMQHPQRLYRLPHTAKNWLQIEQQLQQHQTLHLNDMQLLVTHIATPQLDKQTDTQLKALIQLLKNTEKTPDYHQQAQAFMAEKAAFIQIWKTLDAASPTLSHFSAAEKALQTQLDRTSFLTLTQAIANSLPSGKKAYGHQHQPNQDDDRSRGGRSY